MNTKRLLALLIYLLFCTFLVMSALSDVIHWKSTKSTRDLPDIMENNILNVVTENNSVDFNVDGNSITGFQYELCHFISQRTGLTIQLFLEKNLETASRKLENKEYDVIAQNIPITNENKRYLTFTIPITQSKQVLVQRKNNNADSVSFIANQLDLANKAIYVTKKSPVVLRLNNIAEEIAEPIHIVEIADCTSEQLIYMVAEKRIDYAVVDKEISLKTAKLFPELDFNTDISFTQLQAWVILKTSPVLLDNLNVWITTFKQNMNNNAF
jgi:membrane-bound lytic murein transglycosylase MltF